MIQHLRTLGIREHDAMLYAMLYAMGTKEKEHEIYFLKQIQTSRLLPLFQRLFGWGIGHTANDVDLQNKHPIEHSDQYCQRGEPARRSKGVSFP